MNGNMVEFYYLLRTEDDLTFFWKWKENQNRLFFLVAHSETAQRLSSLAWCDFNTFTLRIPWALITPNTFLLGELGKLFQSTSSPLRGPYLPFRYFSTSCKSSAF
jgi:hypothetical protein